MYENTYQDATVLITGHTGFKGSWLALYLKSLGADVVGYALKSPTVPSLFEQTELKRDIVHIEADIRDQQRLKDTLRRYRPAFIFHMAAQSLVLRSYQNPIETFEVNVVGSLNVLEAVRETGIRTQVIMVVTDKCYQNKEWVFGYRENDPLGGHDPYSASKAAMDMAVQSYRASFFPQDHFDEHGVGIAQVRSGNVIGGGDWAKNRIVPDAIRSFINGQPIAVRSPRAVRPWQHVLEPLSGYLWLGAKMVQNPVHFSTEWNFGPYISESQTVAELVQALIDHWQGSAQWVDASKVDALHEANTLRLNIDKAIVQLGWHPIWDFQTTVKRTAHWYQQAYSADAETIRALCMDDIQSYQNDAIEKELAWTS